MRIPRRPPWNEETSKEELLALEKETFLSWRRQLAQLQEKENIILTPYEKNIEFWRQLWRVIERSDIVVQIVDARNPYLFWCEDLEYFVKEINPNKVTMILLNKSDYLTPSQRESWANYFNKIKQNAVFFSALQQNNSEEYEDDQSISLPFGELNISKNHSQCDELSENKPQTNFKTFSHLVTRNELLEIFKNLHCGQKVKEDITTVGLVGYPNVGKSSTINSLLQCKKVSVSATPGKTKHFQTLMIDPKLCLCDCPGLVFPNFVSTKAEMILNGILPIDNMTDPIPPITLIVNIIPRHVLQATYRIFIPSPREGEDINRPPTAEEFLNAYGYMRGFITQRSLPDVSRSARYILKDFVNGKLLYCHAPPGMDQAKYHTFPSADTFPNITPSQGRISIDNKISTHELDEAFFKKPNSAIHTKSSHQVSGSSSSLNEKPWKKHYNRNKKEKLRRVYSYLDK